MMTQLPDNSETPTPLSSNELSAEHTELAKYRSRAATVRTPLAWLRTSLSLISFSLGIPTIIHAIEKYSENTLSG